MLMRTDGRDGPLPREDKGEGVEVHLSAQLKMAGGAGKAPAAAGHVRVLMVVDHTRRC